MQLIVVCETRSSNRSDYKYIKSVIDYFYKPRAFAIKKVFAKSKPELIKKDTAINSAIKQYPGHSCVVLFADVDTNDNVLNGKIIDYCKNHSFELVWMNGNIEEVFLGKKIDKNKSEEADAYLANQLKILPKLTNLSEKNVMTVNKSSNILLVLNKLLPKK